MTFLQEMMKKGEEEVAKTGMLPKVQELSKGEQERLLNYTQNLSLDTFIEPSVYQIDIDFDFKNLTYTGFVKIFGKSYTRQDKTAFDASQLQLHSVGGEITSAGVQLGDHYYECTWRRIDSDIIELVPPEDKHWYFSKPTEEMVVEIEFASQVSDGMMGLYMVICETDNADVFGYACTQCEPNGARMIFPLVDDPIAKAIFMPTVTVDEGIQVLSNTSLKHEVTEKDGRVKYIFGGTPKMSSYLFALAIGKFHKHTLTTKKGLEMTYYTETAKDLERSKYAQSISEKIVNFFEEKFAIDYPLTKLDQIAVNKFIVSAMENWGLITYRKTAMLQYDPKDFEATLNVLVVIAHEISHQWFGNLVTMKWWNDLWLNEGFASEMMYRASNAVDPDLFPHEIQLLSRMLPAYFQDALLASHPISVDVEKPEDIFEVFDAISYAKGSAFLKMLIEYAGIDNFYSGVSEYLKKFQYSNADCNDFLEAINDKCKIPNLLKISEEWLKCANYPIVYVKRDGDKFILQQAPYMMLYSNTSKVKTVWKIPLMVKSVMGKAVVTQKMIMDDTRFIVPAEAADEFKIFNSDTSGFFLVVYDIEFYVRLPEFIESLSKYDLYTLFLSFYLRATSTNHAGDSSGVKVFTVPIMLTVLTKINNYLPPLLINLIATLLISYYGHYERLKDKEPVLKGINALFEDRFTSLTKECHSPNFQIPVNVELMQTKICLLMAIYRPDFTLEMMKGRFATFDDVTAPFVESYATAMVGCVGEANEAQSAFDFLFTKYRESEDINLKQKILSSLPFVSKPDLRQKVYESMLDGAIQPMDYIFVTKSIGLSSKSSMEFFDFIDQGDRFDVLNEKTGTRLGFTISSGFNQLYGLEMIDRLEKMFEGKKHSAKMAIKTVRERIEINSWKDDSEDEDDNDEIKN